MVKGFIRLTGKYSGDPIYLSVKGIIAVIPLKSLPVFDRLTEGSAIYTDAENLMENNYLCVLECSETVMKLIEEAEKGMEQ